MLTTSNDEEDKIEAFNLNVAGYMLKSDIGQSFVKAVELVDNYWRVMEFPCKSSGGAPARPVRARHRGQCRQPRHALKQDRNCLRTGVFAFDDQRAHLRRDLVAALVGCIALVELIVGLLCRRAVI